MNSPLAYGLGKVERIRDFNKNGYSLKNDRENEIRELKPPLKGAS